MSFSKILTTLCIIPIIMIPYLLNKVFHYRMSETLKLIYYVFIYIALVLGSIIGLYHSTSWLDLLAHFLSGIVSCIGSLIILKEMKLLKKVTPSFLVVFLLSISLSIASIWEFFEFGSDKIFGSDSQFVKETGVNDTMEDMLIAFSGSILFTIIFTFKLTNNYDKTMKSLERII
ncbi:MAG: DUF2238 domain-containing protein [Firmicutes bacterium]|nr:DUF2238 domain-containing protein [Bacillota bacterium]